MVTVTLFVRWSSLPAGFGESRFPRVLWFTLSHCCYPRRPLLGGGVTLTACHSSAASGVELQTKVREDFTITEKAQLALCLNSFLIMKAVGASNQVKAIVGTFSVIGKSSRPFVSLQFPADPGPGREAANYLMTWQFGWWIARGRCAPARRAVVITSRSTSYNISWRLARRESQFNFSSSHPD